MEQQILRLRKQIARRQRHSTRGRGGYGAELRSAVADLAAAWKAAGGSRRELARQLGIGGETLARWCRPSSTVRKVVVVEDTPTPTTSAIAVDLPGGVRATGLTIAQVAELSRLLS